MLKHEKFAQLDISDWPMGLSDPIAYLALLPSEIARRGKILFSRDYDDLDYFDAAILRFAGGQEVALQHHLRAPTPGTSVLVDRLDRRALTALAQLLGLKPREVIWTSDTARNTVRSVIRRTSYVHRPVVCRDDWQPVSVRAPRLRIAA